MDLGLAGRVAVITGGSKGIGLGIAGALVDEGCHVVICARHQQEVEQAATSLAERGPAGTRAVAVAADVTIDSDRQALVEQAIGALGSIDILINNAAAVGNARTIDGSSVEDWRSVFELNVFAAVHLVQLVLPYMQDKGWGRIINISSENGTQPYPDMIAYSSSKGALDNFSKALSKQCARHGILVNTVSPAFIETPAVEAAMEGLARDQGISRNEAIRRFLTEHRPNIALERPGRVDEVGPIVALLCSDKASFVNGANVRVDSGSVASV